MPAASAARICVWNRVQDLVSPECFALFCV